MCVNTTQAEKIQTTYLNPPPSVKPLCKKNHPQNNAPSKKLTWTNFWRWYFYKKQPFQKPKSHGASKVTTSPQKIATCNLSILSIFQLNPWGGPFLPGGNHKQSYPEPWRCKLLSVTTGAVGYRWNRCWKNISSSQDLENFQKRLDVMLKQARRCFVVTWGRFLGWFRWKGLLGSTWMFGWGLLGISKRMYMAYFTYL